VWPAAAVHIRCQGKVVYEQAAGWLDPEARSYPTQRNTYFDLASLTKLFTATAFLRLVAAGKVGLDAPVVQVLPEFGGPHPIQPYEDPLQPGAFIRVSEETEPVEASAVTFRHLLTHSSGLPAWRPLYRQPANRIRQTVLSTFFAYPPGATVLYSDLGFILLGWAIEQLTDQRLDQALTQLVLTPLHLSSLSPQSSVLITSFGPLPPSQTAPTEYCPWRGRRMQGEVHDENAWAMGGIAGHAGLFGPASAVATLGQIWLDTLNGLSPFLPQPLAREATSRQAEAGAVRRGLGWALWSPDPDSPSYPLSASAFGHTGFTGVSLYIDPERQLVIACLTNDVYCGREKRSISSFRLALHELIGRVWS
jgi:CubicO group peptidase (beta-lactamase class C family)